MGMRASTTGEMGEPVEWSNPVLPPRPGLETNSLMTPPSPSPLILIVEDELVTSLTLERILGTAGYRTATAVHVAEAWRRIHDQSPDLILLDVSLPDGNGFEVCEAMRKVPSLAQVPIVFMSASNDVNAKVRGLDAGGMDYISKPLAGAEVLARIRSQLRSRRTYEEPGQRQVEQMRELTVAQQNTMPKPADLPEARFEVELKQQLAAGGDFYDVIPLEDGVVDYLVADASGHSLGASYWTAALKALLSEYSSRHSSPVDVLGALNVGLRRILPNGAFFTMIYARLDRAHHRLSLVSAGHPPAIMTLGRSRKTAIIQQEGDVIGAFSDPVFGFSELTTEPGDRLFLYSDGVVESNGQFLPGVNRLAAACQNRMGMPLAEVLPSALSEVATVTTDDVVLMGVDI